MPSLDISGPINIQDVHKAPDTPGLYVWYARFHVGKADWHSEYAGNNDAAQSSFLRVLQNHSFKFGQQEMSVRTLANFSTVWKGMLKEDAPSRWQGGFDINVSEDRTSALSMVLGQNHTREVLVEIINNSFPLFNSPLYLGLAVKQTLKDRLIQHRNTYLDLWGRYVRDKEIVNRIGTPKDFAERAITLGFGPEDLFCYTLALNRLPEDNLTSDEINKLIISSEWILNRWTTPILGRK